MEVETGTVSDADAVADLWVRLAAEQSAFGSYVDAEDNRAAIREEASRHAVADCLLVVRDDDEIVGFVMVGLSDSSYESHGTRGVVENLYVVEDYRNQGVGSDLLASAEAALRERGVDRISLEAMAGNEAARRFYRRHGYDLHRVRLNKPVERGRPGDSYGPGESDNH